MATHAADLRLAAHYALVEVLAEADSVEAAAPQLLRIIGEFFGWELATLWLVDFDRDRLRWAEAWSAPGVSAGEFERLTRGSEFARGEGLPGLAWAEEAPVWLDDALAEPRFLRADAAAASGLRAAVVLPILGHRRIVGVMEFFSREIRGRDDDFLALVRVLGRQVGQFVERRWAEARVAHSEGIKSAVIGSALDCVITMDARGCVVDFNPAAERTFGHSREEAIGRELAELIVPPDLRDAHRAALGRYLETGEGRILDQRLELRACRADGSEFPVELTVTALGTPEQPAFAGYIRDITDRVQAQEEVAGLLQREQAARLRAEAAERQARHIAVTLQRSLLPPHLPLIPGIDIAAAFRAAGDGAMVGGDFYDVFQTGPSTWCCVIGDVCGKGPEAAATTALARYTVRAAAMREGRPRSVLATLNSAFAEQAEAEFCTAAYACMDFDGDRVRLTTSVAGHPLPLVLRADGTVEAAGRYGTLLGAVDDPRFEDVQCDLSPGDALVLYTDGVIEARMPEGGRFGTDRLEALLAGCAGCPAAVIAGRIEAAVEGGASADDVAIVVARIAPSG